MSSIIKISLYIHIKMIQNLFENAGYEEDRDQWAWESDRRGTGRKMMTS